MQISWLYLLRSVGSGVCACDVCDWSLEAPIAGRRLFGISEKIVLASVKKGNI